MLLCAPILAFYCNPTSGLVDTELCFKSDKHILDTPIN